MGIEVTYDKNKVKIDFSNSITDDLIEEMDDLFKEIINNDEITIAILNMKNVNSITSSGIGKILKLYKHFDRNDGSLKLIEVPLNLMNLFKEIHLDKVIPMS